MKSSKINYSIALLAALIFIPLLGAVNLFDWDEINFAESAREMIVSGDYLNVQINFQPFWEKPPLFIWMQVFSMKIFGINEFAARFPNAVCGIVTLLILFNTGRRFAGKKFGIFWVFAYGCSLLPNLYFKSGIIDPWFNLFIFTGIYFFSEFINSVSERQKYMRLILSAIFIGLAILTKGPVALIIYLLVVFIYYIIKKFKGFPSFGQVLIFVFALSVVGGFWFILQILQGRMDVVREFIVYQVRLFSTKDAGHGGFFLYHFVVLLIGVFPASILALPAFKRKYFDGNNQQERFRLIMLILFWTVLILFTIVKTKIVHYSSLCYFPLTFLAANFLYKTFRSERIVRSWTNILLWICIALYSTLLILLPIIGKYHELIIKSAIIKDSFAMGNLQAEVNWGYGGYMAALIFVIFAGIILTNKKLIQKKYLFLLGLNLIYIVFSLIYIVPRVERYSQHAAIQFYETVAKQDCYVETLGFKSYAQLYYAAKMPVPDIEKNDSEWMLKGKIRKKAYFVIKISNAGYYFREYPELYRIYEKNGFVFAGRLPESK